MDDAMNDEKRRPERSKKDLCHKNNETPPDLEKSSHTGTRALPVNCPSALPGPGLPGLQQDNDVFGHLPEQEATVLKAQIDVFPIRMRYLQLYRSASHTDLLILLASAICAIAAGAAMPLMTVIFGQVAGSFQGFVQGNVSPAAFQSSVNRLVLFFVYLAIAEFVTVYIYTVGFMFVGDRITRRIRGQYLASILRQNMAFFDKLGSGEIVTRITSDTILIQDGISEKAGLTLTAIATLISAYVIGFVFYWRLTLILMSTFVAVYLTTKVFGKAIVKYSIASLTSYAEGGSVAEEAISSIRNVTAFGPNTQKRLTDEYDGHLNVAEKAGIKTKATISVMVGLILCYVYLTYALAFWQGSRYLVAGDASISDIITILLAIMTGAFSLSGIAPNIQAFTAATTAATKIFTTIERISAADPDSEAGEKLSPETCKGTITLRNVKHIYPSRPGIVALDDINLVFPAGKTTALVGESGSGKSSIVGLIERFYTPVGGEILLDGNNVQELNLRWLRQQLGLVSQEPTLFATTIFENICQGLVGTDHEFKSVEEKLGLVETAAKIANAHDFICQQLPQGYQTNVGERGALMSGGQKQRIAIARAIVGDPKILLLDEATSALDVKSEGVVQAALAKAAEGRTTISIAHRLSTIKNAHNIVVLSHGQILEQGTHDQLLRSKGAYYGLVEAQRIAVNAGEDQPIPGDEKELAVLVGPLGIEKDLVDAEDLDLAGMTSRSTSGKGARGTPLEPASEHSLWSLIRLVASFNSTEWHWMTLGLVNSILSGACNPVNAIFFAKAITALTLPPSQYGLLRMQSNFWSWMYLMVALVQLLTRIAYGIFFGICSEKMIHRAREAAFRTMLRQDIAFFDRSFNTVGALTSFLSTQTVYLAGISGVTLGTLLQTVTTLVVAFLIAVVIGWKLALVCTATVPIVLLCGFWRVWILTRFQANSRVAYADSASYASEAVAAIRTIAALTREKDVRRHYHEHLQSHGAKFLRSVLRSSLLFAASQSLLFLCMAIGLWYGVTLVASGEYSMFQFYVCYTAVIFGAQSAGTVFSFAPDIGKAKNAAGELKTLFDRRPKIDSWSPEGEVLENMDGTIEFRDVWFSHPSRPERPVFRGLDFTVKAGQYVALVGPSGCGKSTTIGLLERFYDPDHRDGGGVYVDGRDISTLNIERYRSHLALVLQEPTLYQGTIRDNIALGVEKGAEDDASIERACRAANIYDFILSLPDGFSTVVGSKGGMLSGGQKQRIAIARALLREPKILLLDEATSALDSESEQVVQAALDAAAAAKGRTTIAVAHRLSTIQKADRIFVLDQGRIAEEGTHAELMRQKGRYYELVNLQSLEQSNN